MKVLLNIGKVLMLLFWLLVVANLVQPFYHPFTTLLQVAGVLVVVLHSAQLVFYRRRLAQVAMPLWARLQTLVFGIFYVYPLAAPQAAPATPVAPVSATAVVEPVSADSQQQELKLENGNA